MTRTAPALFRRATALLAVLVLLFPSVGEAMGHACPHHGPGGAAHADAELAAAPHAAGHAAAPQGMEHDDHPSGHGAPCTCVGTCQAGSLPVLPPPPAAVLPLLRSAAPAPPAPGAPVRSRFPAFFLPYAQGPPPSR